MSQATMEVEGKEVKNLYSNLFSKESIQSEWSNIHVITWKNQKEDLNRFFFYFHKPFESLRRDEMNQDEKILLLKTLFSIWKEVGDSNLVKGFWGIISLLMPYRNGVQCYKTYLDIREEIRSQREEQRVFFKNKYILLL